MMPSPTPSPSPMGGAGGPPSPMGGAGAPPPQGGGGGDPKSMIIQVLQKAKQMSDQAGLNWNDLVAQAGGGAGNMPKPPMPPAGGKGTTPPAPPIKGAVTSNPNSAKPNGLY